MERHEATFEVDTEDEARAVAAILGKVYDSVREEAKTVSSREAETDEMLAAFRAARDAARREAPGRLTVVYERADSGFDE